MNTFGGDWTKAKIEILVEYAKAYLAIMKNYPYYKLMYFDGFAGSGFIEKEKSYGVDVTVGATRRIIELDMPKSFDRYYFVEKDQVNFNLLEQNTKFAYPHKTIHTVYGDCNNKMLDMSEFLRKPENKYYRTLAYIDPCGMQVEWQSIASLKGLSVDMWVLVPTGLGVNRLLKNNGDISDAWLTKLEKFLGLQRDEIEKYFYTKKQSLFDFEYVVKEKDAIDKSAKLYQKRLNEVFPYVSSAYELKNSTNSVMYHLYLATTNKSAVSIGNDIVRKYNR